MKQKRRLITGTIAILLFLFLMLPANLFAFSFSGFTNLVGSGGWENPDNYTTGDLQADLLFTVELDEDTGLWTYTYNLGLDNKELSHFIIETSHVDYYGTATFTNDNVKDGTTYPGPDAGLGIYTEGNGNWGLPSTFYGFKWDTTPEDQDPPSGFDTFDYTYEYILVSDRAPMWGNLYLKDGKDGGIDTYAYNLGWGTARDGIYASFDPDNPPASTLEGFDFALVPDSETTPPNNPVPEPGTFILLGAGLIGILTLRRKIKR